MWDDKLYTFKFIYCDTYSVHCASDSHRWNLLHEISCSASYRLTQPTTYHPSIHPSTALCAAQTLSIFHTFPSLQSHPINIYATSMLYMIIKSFFSFSLHRFQAGFDAHVENSPMGTRSPIPRIKRPFNEPRQLPPSKAGATTVRRRATSSNSL